MGSVGSSKVGGLKDLPSAMAAMDGLLNYKLSQASTSESKSSKHKRKDKRNDKQTSGFKKVKAGYKSKQKGEESQNKREKSNFGCFICDGPHHAKDCPKREKLNAIVTKNDKDGSDSDGPTRVNPLQLLNTIHSDKAP